MSDKTGIEWTDATWMVAAWRNGTIVFSEAELLRPLRWKKPRRVSIPADLFELPLQDEIVDRIFAVMALCPKHTFQVLTKWPERMLAYLCGHGNSHRRNIPVYNAAVMICAGDFSRLSEQMAHHRSSGEGWWPLPNVWLGVLVEDQKAADVRIPLLLQTPAAVRFISAEPLLGPLDLWRYLAAELTVSSPAGKRVDAETGRCLQKMANATHRQYVAPLLDWCIAGGESGKGSGIRPSHPDWFRSLRDQCAMAGVPFFFKQWGEWVPNQQGADEGRTSRQEIRLSISGGRIDELATDCCDRGTDVVMNLCGKRNACDLLDGVQHHAFPVQP